WNLSTHTMLYAPLPGDAVAASPDGTTLVTRTDARYQLFDVATGQPRGPPLSDVTPPADFPEKAWFSADGRYLAVDDGLTNSVRVVDVATRQLLPTLIPLGATRRYPGGLLNHGRLSVYIGQTMSLWRIDARAPAPFATPIGPSSVPTDTFFTPDGNRLFTTTATRLDAWDPATGTRDQPPPGGPYNMF